MSAKKSMPSVLFYPADYLVGVIGMTWEEQGRYMYLLCLQQQKGHINIDAIMPDCPDSVREKFVVDEGGLHYNVRMEEEMQKRYKYSESRRRNRLSSQDSDEKLSTAPVDKSDAPVDNSSYEKHMSNICNDICQSYEKHMDNDNDNDNNNDSYINKKKCRKTSEIIEEAANGTAYEELDEQTQKRISKQKYEETAKMLQ